MLELTKNPIDVNSFLKRAATDEDGGVVLFLGTVRRHSRGEKIVWLDYEAYPPMVIESFKTIAEEVLGRWGVERISILHRLGRLLVGEVAVAVSAASPHRREAFEACHYVIDRIKEISPIWKKEFTEDGAVWVGSIGDCSDRDRNVIPLPSEGEGQGEGDMTALTEVSHV